MTVHISPDVQQRLTQFNQEHLLSWWDELGDDQCRDLLAQIEAIDFARIKTDFAARGQSSDSQQETPADIAQRAVPPSSLIRRPQTDEDRQAWQQATALGNELLTQGKVGVILVAGGQGTRLGFPHPKGMFPIGPVSEATLFQILAEQLRARARQAGCVIPYYIMTSAATHTPTVEFFEQHDYFSLGRENVFFFQQGTMPAVDDQSGKVLLRDKSTIAKSPDGHGGMLQALARTGALDDMRQRGIEVLYYHQVDNPTAVVCDPAFLGFHLQQQSELSTKVVAKRSADEKMGVLCDVDGQTQIIEYSDLPDDIAAKTDSDGGLLLWAGNMAIHVFNRSFFERLAQESSALPFHLAHKVVPCLNDRGEPTTPDSPNAIKFERFIFDALPWAERALVLEADRTDEFNPVKNAEGNDSPATAKQALIDLHRQWVTNAKAVVDDGVVVEISPLFALDAAEVENKIQPGERFSADTYLH